MKNTERTLMRYFKGHAETFPDELRVGKDRRARLCWRERWGTSSREKIDCWEMPVGDVVGFLRRCRDQGYCSEREVQDFLEEK